MICANFSFYLERVFWSRTLCIDFIYQQTTDEYMQEDSVHYNGTAVNRNLPFRQFVPSCILTLWLCLSHGPFGDLNR